MSVLLEEMAGSQGSVSAGASTICPDEREKEKGKEQETEKEKNVEPPPLDEPLEHSGQGPPMVSMADAPEHATGEAQAASPLRSLVGWRLVVVETW